ncbi:sensor histidine kinase [Cytobacillus solani]|uniref:Signal transduction histidine-protein kinase/phosphatase DegS n=1 Tax=Cytobacillus solani TaxID=1637975 RepID=A0A0Q3QUA9_9BACI|nr:sensor histidine kinase [Cytobacillus solani]KOP71996.1 histidine kinase [Bacillus sp. FJAT-21945]KQL21342.1 histidine kinase [Cytobacillus solani]USK54631.1 sensor histidine kinase [Cytobacillus solani]
MSKKKKLDTKTLDLILEKMIDTVDISKNEIFRIGEQCRKDHMTLSDELKAMKEQVAKTISEGDRLDVQTRFARKRLSEVSMHFKDYTEAEVRDAYEKAHQLQMNYSMNQQIEKQLRDRRDDIERRLIGLQETIERAEHLISQITVVMNYLTSDLQQVGEMLEDAKMKQDFGLKIIAAQEEERKRVSREIHDGPAQMMANVMMRSDLIERVYRERGSNEAFKEIRDLKKMVRNALYEVRRIIYDLRPMALDDLGLVPTLKKYLQTTEEYHKKTKIVFANLKEEKRLPANYEVALFRLIQESVQNAIKHARPSEIQVKLEIDKSKVSAIIKDDGIGFDTSQKKTNSFGLIGMRERVELLEGELSIDSKIGKGTVVLIQVPIICDSNN